MITSNFRLFAALKSPQKQVNCSLELNTTQDIQNLESITSIDSESAPDFELFISDIRTVEIWTLCQHPAAHAHDARAMSAITTGSNN